MNKKMVLTLSLVMTLFTSTLVAAEFEAPTKPTMVLTAEDLNIIDGAIASDFKGLSKADKKKLKSFLADYATSVKREKIAMSKSNKPSKKGKKSLNSKKVKGIKKYKSGSIIK